MILSISEMTELGFSPVSTYGFKSKLPDNWKMPASVSDLNFMRLPLCVQVFYDLVSVNGFHHLTGGPR